MANGCLGHVIHNLDGMKAVHKPSKPDTEALTEEELDEAVEAHERAMEKWLEGDVNAVNILVLRTSEKIRPPNFLNTASKEIFDHVSQVRELEQRLPGKRRFATICEPR